MEQGWSCDDIELGRIVRIIVRNLSITQICTCYYNCFLQNDNLTFGDMLKYKYRKQEHKNGQKYVFFISLSYIDLIALKFK